MEAILTGQGDDRLDQLVFVFPSRRLIGLGSPRLSYQPAGVPFTQSLPERFEGQSDAAPRGTYTSRETPDYLSHDTGRRTLDPTNQRCGSARLGIDVAATDMRLLSGSGGRPLPPAISAVECERTAASIC